jgi:DNA-directed RNA polymerase specialized sigma subunit
MESGRLGETLVHEDVHSQGVLAFIEAIPRWDPDQDVRLNSFCRYAAIGAMRKHALDMGLPMRSGTSSAERKAIYALPRVLREFEATHGRQPNGRGDIAQIADSLGTSPASVDRAMTRHVSEAVPVEMIDETETATDPLLEVDLSRVRDILLDEVRHAMSETTARNAQIVLTIAVGAGKGDRSCIADLADRHGITKERVGQIYRREFGRIKSALIGRGLSPSILS